MDDLEKLYKAVSVNFDIGTFDEFSNRMQTVEDRKKFYDVVNNNGFDLGDYDTYESRLKKKDSGFRTVSELGGKQEGVEYEKQVEEFELPTEEKTVEFQKEQQKQREETQEFLTTQYTKLIGDNLSVINENITTLENDYFGKKAYDSGDWGPTLNPDDIQEAERLKSLDYADLESRLSRNRKSKEILELAQNYIETKDDGFLKTLKNQFDDDFITMGISDIVRDFDMIGIARKYNKNPESLTDDEQQALLAYGLFSDVKEKLDTSRGQTVGSGVMESIPFLVQFAIGGGFTAPAKKLGKELIKRGTKKSTAKLLAGISSTLLRTGGLAPTIAKGTEERLIGNIDVEMEDGQPVPVVREGTQAGLGEALGKSWTQAYISVLSEGLGQYAKPAKSYLLKKIGASNIDDYMKSLSKTRAGEIMNKVQLQGIPVEFGEEIVEKYLNKAILNEGSWGFEEDELLNTLLTVSVISGTPATIGTGQIVADRIREKKQNKINAQQSLLVKTRIEVDNILTQDKPINEIGSDLNDYIKQRIDEGLDRDGVQKIVEYATAKTETQTIDELQTIKTEQDAIQEREAKTVPVGEQTRSGEGVRTQGEEQVREEVAPEEEVQDVLTDQPSVETGKKPVTQEEKPVSETVKEKTVTTEVTQPVMITKDMKQQLSDLGYSKEDISGFKPEEANTIIEQQTTKELAEQPITETKTEVKKEEEISKSSEQELAEPISFEFMGEKITGEVIDQGENMVKIKDDTGTVHTITPSTTMYKNIKGVPFEVKSEVEAKKIKENIDKEITKTKKERLTEKETEIKNRLADRLQKLSGSKFAEGGEKVDKTKEVFGVINDLAELGLIKLEQGIDHVLNELKKYIPDAYSYRKEIENNFYGKTEGYDKVLKSIDERKIAEEKFNKRNKKKRREIFNKLIVDKSENFRKELIKIDKEQGQRAADYFNLQAGMSAKSKEDLSRANKKIFGKFRDLMSQSEQDLLAEYIDKKRIVELDNLYDKRGEKRLKHEGGITSEEAQNFINAIENKDQKVLDKLGLKDIDINAIKKGADAYYETIQENLTRLNKEGIISDDVYKKLKEEQPFYSKRMYIQHINNLDGNGSLSGIESLKEGSEGNKVVDIQTLLGDNIIRTNNIIAANKARKAISEFAEKNPENTLIVNSEYSKSYLDKIAKELEKPVEDRKYIEPSFIETPKGYKSVDFFVNGEKRRFYVEESMFEEFKPEPDSHQLNMIKNILGWASGTKILKASATGYNPEFAVKNIPLDMLHIMTSTEVYSPVYPVATAQMLNDIRKIHKDAITRTGRYQKYIEQGGGMEYLTQQGSLTPRKFKKYTKFNQGVKAVGDVASYLGSTSEILTRLALRDRYINNELSKLDKKPTPKQLEDIEYRGTAYARNYLDFSQGGSATKFLDSVIPYLNAGMQVTRGTLRAAKRNPKVFWGKMGQLGGTAALLTAYNLGMFSGGDDDEKKEMADYYMNSISERNKANNFIIMTGLNYTDVKGTKKYIYVKIPKDQTQQLVTGLFEDIFVKYVYGDTDHQIMNNRRLMEFKALTKNVGDLSSTPPMITAINGYKNNINDFYNEAIWYGNDFEKEDAQGIFFRGDLSQEYTVGRTPERFVKWGELTNMSPERTRYAVQQFITQNNVIGSMMGEALDYALVGKDEIKQELNKDAAQKLKEFPFTRRFLGETSDYAKGSAAEEAQKEIDRNKAMNDHKLDRLILSESSADKVINFIVHQEPYEAERLMKKYINKKSFENINGKIKQLPFYAPEARAAGYYDLIKGKSVKEITEITNQAKLVGGIITDGRFKDELIKLMIENDEDLNNVRFIKDKNNE